MAFADTHADHPHSCFLGSNASWGAYDTLQNSYVLVNATHLHAASWSDNLNFLFLFSPQDGAPVSVQIWDTR